MVHKYKQITYQNIYPNIDIVFSIPKDSLKPVEYNFIVHPNGKIADIQLKFSGTETQLVDNKIQMQVRFGEMEETLPMSWTEDGECKKEINVGYKKIKNNVYGFETSENVSNKTVVIDPVPTRLWGTFYGGEKAEYTLSLEIDILGNSYICGTTSSMNFIATSGAHQNVFGSSIYYGPHLYITDSFVAKFDENGNRLWSTFYGGDTDDDIKDIAVSNNGLIGFCGNTRSNNNISTIGTFKDFKSGSYTEMYFGVLNSNGVRLWASYYGNDNGLTFANCILVDKQNYFYLSGTTTSDAFISTPNSFKETIIDNNRFDGFLAKFDQIGNRIWGTYFGGDKDDYIEDLTLDSNNNVIIVGYTISTNGISTPNSFQQYLSSNENYDGFIASFTNTGLLKWGTYFGGDGDDKILRVKNFNNTLYFSGTTNSDGLATANAFETINQNGTSFISKFSIQNQQKIWLSYSSPEITDFDINQNEEIYLVGNSKAITNIATSNAFNTNNSGFASFIRKINNDCKIIWGTYLGSQGFINNPYIKYLNSDIFYVAGTCYSYWLSPQFTNYGLTTPNSFQEISNGNQEAFINKFKDCNLSSLASSNSPICIGKDLELKASGGTNYIWTGPNGFTSTDQNPIITNATAINAGQYSCIITGTGGCDDTKTVDVIIGDIVAPVPTLTILPTITGDCHTQITTITTATDACAGIITATTTSPLSYSLPGTYTIVWNYDDGNGNSFTQNQTVIISSQPLPTIASPQTFCIQQNATLSDIAITGQNIKWYDALTNGNLLVNTTLLQNGLTYFASQTINGCESERAPVLINILNTSAPNGNTNQPFCSAQNPTLQNISITGQNIKWYDALTNGNILPNNTNLQNDLTYYASQTVNSCESERVAISVSIQNTPAIPTGDANPKFCKSENATLNNITINGQNLKWYDSNTATIPLVNSTLLQNNTTYYVSQTFGCESNRLAVLVSVNDSPLPTANTSQTFCIDENATISNIVITGTNLKWYDSPTEENLLPTTTTLENKTYYATQTNTNCESQRLAINIKIQNTQVPILDTNQYFCVQQNATINNIQISGQNIKWYNSLIGGTNLSKSTPLENGITYYASQIIANCESERIPITIQIHEATTADCINYVDELPFLKFFTPNGDDYNDTWKIDFAYLAPNSVIRIFDRYGKMLKELNSNSSGWDGNYKNQPLPSTDYWFLVTRVNGKEYKGHFSLKR